MGFHIIYNAFPPTNTMRTTSVYAGEVAGAQVFTNITNCYKFNFLSAMTSIDLILHGHSREQVRAMFQHAYDGYLKYAADYDELRPLTCDGVDTWGSYSLTLIDALDTLAVMGNYSEFRRVASLLETKMNFDKDINVSVFETNIRILGGLLSAHLFSKRAGIQVEDGWPCQGPLLRLAEDVAKRLLPAFDTATGMPYGTVNLRHGVPKGETTVTCTAGVGTFLVEFGTLSRLTGNPLYEEVALNAAYTIWSQRSQIGLLGNHIDIKSGRWTALDSGIGAGVDSFFEYLVKGAILLNRPNLLEMFNEARVSIDKYLKRDDWYIWVHMHKGLGTLPVFQSLEAFWPGILGIIGDVGPAMRTLSKYIGIWKKYGFLPEFYNILLDDTQVNRETYPLRPELIESAMYLYRATKNEFLLEFGEQVLESIEFSAKTKCGYATIRNVVTHEKENRMESFFLAETTKYLYLLFDHDNLMHRNGGIGEVLQTPNGECVVHSGPFIFNTEAHPIDLSALHCCHDLRKNIFETLDLKKFSSANLLKEDYLANAKNREMNMNFECSQTPIFNDPKPSQSFPKENQKNKNKGIISVDIEVYDDQNEPAGDILVERFEKIRKESNPNYKTINKDLKRNQLTIMDLEEFFAKKRSDFKNPDDILKFIKEFMKNFTLDTTFIKGLQVFDKSILGIFGNEIQKIYETDMRNLMDLYAFDRQFAINIALIRKYNLLAYTEPENKDTLESFIQAFNLSASDGSDISKELYLRLLEAGKLYEKSMTNTTRMQEFLFKIFKNGSYNNTKTNFTILLNETEIKSLPMFTLDLEETFEVFEPLKRLLEIKKTTMETFEKLQTLMKDDAEKPVFKTQSSQISNDDHHSISNVNIDHDRDHDFYTISADITTNPDVSIIDIDSTQKLSKHSTKNQANESDSVWTQLVQAILRTATSQIKAFDEEALSEKTKASLEKYKNHEMKYELFSCRRPNLIEDLANRVYYPSYHL